MRLLWAMAAVALTACAGGDDDAPTPIVPTDTGSTAAACAELTWENFGDGFVRTWCSACHSRYVTGDWRQCAPEGVPLDTLADVRLWAGEIDRKVQGEVAGPPPDDATCDGAPLGGSCTCVEQSDMQMPPAGGLSAEDKAQLHAWIACGAPGEVTTPAACTLAVPQAGDLTIADPSDAAAFCESGANRVAGDLTVTADAAVALDCLCGVDGTVTVGPDVPELALPAAVDVGALVVDDAAALTRLSAPLLEHVTVGGVSVQRADALVTLELPWLSDVAGDVVFADLAAGDDLDLDHLAWVGGRLEIRGISAVTAELSRVYDVGGDLVVADNPYLVSADELKSVARIGGGLTVAGNAALGSIDMMDVLTEIGGDILLSGNPSVTRIDGFTLLPAAAAVQIEANAALAGVEGFDSVATLGSVSIRDNPSLVFLVGFVNADVVAGDLAIERNGQLGSLAGFELLREVGGDLLVRDSQLQVLAKLLSLETVGGTVGIAHNSAMGDISGLTALTAVGGDLVIDDNRLLAARSGLTALDTIGGSLVITSNERLPLATAEALRDQVGIDDIGADVVILNNGP
jgi:hypothetical protein